MRINGWFTFVMSNLFKFSVYDLMRFCYTVNHEDENYTEQVLMKFEKYSLYIVGCNATEHLELIRNFKTDDCTHLPILVLLACYACNFAAE